MPTETTLPDAVPAAAAPPAPDIRIVVLPRGWVVVGHYRDEPDGRASLSLAAVVRRWGTDRGLGEIAALGPRKATVLDRCPLLTIERAAIVLTMRCDPAAWQGALA